MSYGYPPQQQAWPSYGYDYGNGYVARRSAPVSVHIVAIVQYMGGLAALAIAALAAYIVWRNPDPGFASGADPVLRDLARDTLITVAAVFGFSGLVAIVLGRKLQRGRNWARILLNLLNLLTVASILYADLKTLHDGRSLAGLIVPVLCLVLLNLRAARSWFHTGTY